MRTWLIAIRPATLPAAVGPVLVGLGAGLADRSVEPRPFAAIACLAVALLLQVAANLANDLSDFRRGTDTPDRAGPTRVAAAGLVSPRRLEAAIAIVIGLAALAGLYLVTVGGPTFVLLGLAAIVSLLAYTGGPLPYGYRGLGDVAVFIFFGLVAVAGTAVLQAGRLELLHVATAIPVGALVTAILVVNNLRDIATDRAAGKRTLAVYLGPRATAAEYLILVVFALLSPIPLVASGWASPWALGALLASPLAASPIAEVLRAADRGRVGDPRRLNQVLRATARLSLAFSILFACGLLAGRWT